MHGKMTIKKKKKLQNTSGKTEVSGIFSILLHQRFQVQLQHTFVEETDFFLVLRIFNLFYFIITSSFSGTT